MKYMASPGVTECRRETAVECRSTGGLLPPRHRIFILCPTPANTHHLYFCVRRARRPRRAAGKAFNGGSRRAGCPQPAITALRVVRLRAGRVSGPYGCNGYHGCRGEQCGRPQIFSETFSKKIRHNNIRSDVKLIQSYHITYLNLPERSLA